MKIAVLGGGNGSAQQHRAVHRLRLRCRDPGFAVQSRGVVLGGGDGGGRVT